MSEGPDLLDLLAAGERPDEPVHAVLPNMGLACRRDILAVMRIGEALGRRVTSFGRYADTVTCPDCLARGDLSAIARQMNSRQAKEQK